MKQNVLYLFLIECDFELSLIFFHATDTASSTELGKEIKFICSFAIGIIHLTHNIVLRTTLDSKKG